MANLTIYLDDKLEQRLRQAAQREQVSVSRLVAQLVASKVAASWPQEFLDLAGTWADEDIERPAHDEPGSIEALPCAEPAPPGAAGFIEPAGDPDREATPP